MNRLENAIESDPFLAIVDDFSLSTETFALLDAIDDEYIRATVELRHRRQYSERVRAPQYGPLFKRLFEMYELSPAMCSAALDYHDKQVDLPGEHHGQA